MNEIKSRFSYLPDILVAQANVISEVKETGEKCKGENAGKMQNFSLKKGKLRVANTL